MIPMNYRKGFSNSLKTVKTFLLRKRPPIDAPLDFINYHSALHVAVRDGDEKKVRDLLHRGANVENTDLAQSTPLHMAIEYGQPHLIRILVKHGADVEATRLDGYTPILLIKNSPRKLECLDELLKHGADLNAKDYVQNNLLNLVVKAAVIDLQLVKKLLRCGIDVNNRDTLGDNCLHIITRNPAIPHSLAKAVAKYLIYYGIDVNAKNLFGETPFHEATAGDLDHLVSMLLRNGASLTEKDGKGRTVFQYAVEKRCYFSRCVMMKHLVISKHRDIPIDKFITDMIENNAELKEYYQVLEEDLVALKNKKIFHCSIYDILCRKVDDLIGMVARDCSMTLLSRSFKKSGVFYPEFVDIWNIACRSVDEGNMTESTICI